MAVMYTHSVFLRFLLIFVLLDVTRGIGSSVKGHFRRKDFPGDGGFNNSDGIKILKNRQHRRSQSDDKSNDIFTEMKSQTRTTVALHCNTSRLTPVGTENATVIWIKLHNEGFTILTAGSRVITNDQRLLSSNKNNSEDWILYIRHSKQEDEGLYKCQICTPSNVSNSLYVKLNLTEAWATIIGSSNRTVDKVGSPLRLSCKLENSIEPPKYIFWYHEDRVINYDLNDGATVREGRQGSELIFPRAQENHAGNYHCVPSNARPASVKVTVPANTFRPPNTEKSMSKKSHPQDLVINMLVLVSIFLVYR